MNPVAPDRYCGLRFHREDRGKSPLTRPRGTIAAIDLNALEVPVFPGPARGTGEGHHPWDL